MNEDTSAVRLSAGKLIQMSIKSVYENILCSSLFEITLNVFPVSIRLGIKRRIYVLHLHIDNKPIQMVQTL